MPATQPIPRNAPDPATEQANRVLAVHNSATAGRNRTPARWDPHVRRATQTGENAGRRVK